MGLLEWFESLSISVWVHESPSVWAQATVMTCHTLGMSVLVGASWVLDLRLLGISKNIPLSAFRWVFRAVAVGLAINTVTGVLLFISKATTWGVALPFLIKMAFVVASVATLFPLRTYLMSVDPEEREVTGRARRLAVISIVAWTGAITAGRLLAYLVP